MKSFDSLSSNFIFPEISALQTSADEHRVDKTTPPDLVSKSLATPQPPRVLFRQNFKSVAAIAYVMSRVRYSHQQFAEVRVRHEPLIQNLPHAGFNVAGFMINFRQVQAQAEKVVCLRSQPVFFEERIIRIKLRPTRAGFQPLLQLRSDRELDFQRHPISAGLVRGGPRRDRGLQFSQTQMVSVEPRSRQQQLEKIIR
jgi:hypothetical protein